MKEYITVSASPERIWRLWEEGYRARGEKLELGSQGRVKSLLYSISALTPRVHFSVIWKTFFTKLIFSQSIQPLAEGSRICYEVQIKGFFAFPARWLLKNRIRQQLQTALRMVQSQLR